MKMNLGQENEKQEFKTGLAQLEKGLKSLTAMLNRGGEGTVYFGVNDDGEVVGVNIGARSLMDIRERAAELIEPRIVCDIAELKDETGLRYIRLHAEGGDTPYSFDGRYYIRTVAADEQAGNDVLRKMLCAGETDLLTQITSDEQRLTFDGLNKMLSAHGIHVDDSAEILGNFGLKCRDGGYNLLAYLLSDQNRFIIKVMRFAGTDKTVVDERITLTGQCLLKSVEDVLNYFKIMHMPKKVDLDDGFRSETPLFDLQSFREAWINACVHNSWASRIPPSVYIFDDRIEIVSYGGLPYGLSEEGFFAGVSKPVNKRLFNVFITCDFSEQSGHGIPQIVKNYGRNAFSFRDGMVTVTIPLGYRQRRMVNSPSVGEYLVQYPGGVPFLWSPGSMPGTVSSGAYFDPALYLSQNQQNVLNFFEKNPRSTLSEAAEACGLSLGGVKKVVKSLQNAGLLFRRGEKSNSVWIVLQRNR